MSDSGDMVSSVLTEAYKELADEHKRILALLDRLKRANTLDGVRPLLDELHTMLMGHFAHEQYPGGFYETMGATAPKHRDDLRELVDDHNHILSAVRGLSERVTRVESTGISEVLEGVAGVVDRLREHEHREHQLAEKLLGIPT